MKLHKKKKLLFVLLCSCSVPSLSFDESRSILSNIISILYNKDDGSYTVRYENSNPSHFSASSPNGYGHRLDGSSSTGANCVITESFDSVAGNHEAKVALWEVVDYIKNADKYTRIGAKLPKGALLYGPSGTGKTLLARAVAGEADCAFIYASGSEFQNMYFGESERIVRELFQKARSQGKPCIIFIDEIDAIGGKRGTAGTSSRHYDNVLNQLLTEMDGFVKNEFPIFVIGATNRKEMLDDALLRPGRLDRHIHVGLPTESDREEILNIYLKKIKVVSSVTAATLAQKTSGFSGAELENLVNEAAFVAVRCSCDVVDMTHFEIALKKFNK